MFEMKTITTPNEFSILNTLNPYTLDLNIFATSPPVFVCKNVYEHPHKNDAKKHNSYDFL